MDRESQADLLRQGAWKWNQWRKGVERPDLVSADLRGVNLRDCNLEGADLFCARLEGADLTSADLGAADLRDANLAGTSLREVNLYSAVLLSSSLRGADVRGASLGLTALCDVDLNEVRGLDTVRHERHSYVDWRTLARSRHLPDVFLVGAGLSKAVITAHRDWEAKADSNRHHCFISYSASDEEFAERLYADLTYHNIGCWFSPEHMRIGDKIRETLDEAIRTYAKVLLVLSEESISSAWVEKEVETAFEEERTNSRLHLIPIRVDNAILNTTRAWAADVRRTRHIGDFSRWKQYDDYQDAFQRLLRDLKTTQRSDGSDERHVT